MRRRWFALSGAAAAWSVLQLVVYPIAAHACYPHATPLDHASPATLAWVTGGAAVVALIVAVAAGVTAVGDLRRARAATGHPTTPPDEDARSDRFLAYASVAASVLFVLAIVVTAITPLLVTPCY
jgi:hypothetical protein